MVKPSRALHESDERYASRVKAWESGKAVGTTIADMVTAGIAKHWLPKDARPYALAALIGIREAGFAVVPKEPTPAMWSELARDIVMWAHFKNPNGQALYQHLKFLGRPIPDWLTKEIPDTDHVPPKGTVAACIYKAMLEAADEEFK